MYHVIWFKFFLIHLEVYQLLEKQLQPFMNMRCEEFLHTFNMKICTHKTRLEVELLCSCSLTSNVV